MPDRTLPDPRSDSALRDGAAARGLVLEGVLAEGGIGTVYAARRAEDGLPVAVKVLQERHAADPGIVSRFRREIEFARRVDHPNVVRALASGELADGRLLLVMERLEGATLGAVVRSEGPLSMARGLDLAEQILAGLAALHAAGVVHRDLQPENVFIASFAPPALTRDRQRAEAPALRASDSARRFVAPGGEAGDRAVLLDLGFAQEPGVDAGDRVTLDSPGALVGTPSFMSPEQATRGRAICSRCDQFAAALLVHYMLTGKLPFRGRDARDVLISIVRSAPTPLRRERRDAPAGLETILARALAKHPDARFASADEMRTAIGQLAPSRARMVRAPSLAAV